MPSESIPSKAKKTAGHTHGRERGNMTTTKKSTRTGSKLGDTDIAPNTRATSTHVFFWGGILSNWCLTSPAFSGTRCLEVMLPKLDALELAHPAPDALSTRILAAHQFVCGEQWMMAIKAWLFERTSVLGEMQMNPSQKASTDSVIGRDQFEALRNAVMQAKPPDDFTQGTKERELYDGTLYAILQAGKPKEQKALGRQVGGFDNFVWNKASIAIVVASCIARAEEDADLRKLYHAAGTRKFVEGSPLDRIWGVGIKWDNTAIDDEENWKGENRLGICHDEASAYIREKAI